MSDEAAGERADAARNRARLLEAAAGLVAERGAEHVTMHAVAEEAGVGKGTLFRRFGDRTGLLLALVDEVEADFHEAYTSGPPLRNEPGVTTERLQNTWRDLVRRVTAADELR